MRFDGFPQDSFGKEYTVESLKHLSTQEHAEAIADKFSKVSQEYEPLKENDVEIPPFDEKNIPSFHPTDVQKNLERININKSVPPGNIPPLITNTFAAQLSVPHN